MNRSVGRHVRSRTRPFACLLLVACVSCATQAGRSGDYSGGERFISEGWILGQTRAEVIARLGAPLTSSVDRFQNQHAPEQIDESYVFRYEGLTLAFYVVKEEPEREFLTDISVTSRRYELGWGLRVGAPMEDVTHLLGDKFVPLRRPDLRPWMPTANGECGSEVCTYGYTDDDLGENHVYFSFSEGRVSRVDWVFWVD